MGEPDGITTPAPGEFWKRPWSKDRELHIRNVEAVGSNPITSRGAQVRGPEVGFPQNQQEPSEGYVALRRGRG